DDVDSTRNVPPAGMFFAPLYPALIAGMMEIDPRFAKMVACAVEADANRRDITACDEHALPMLLLHALFLCFGVLAIASASEAMFGSVRLFYAAGSMATLGLAAEADLFSFMMTGSVWFSFY